ncbi:PREDICTED: probable malonyl-CoA-acyl carrier protein transacylase, mitochondrial [Trachymyrmex cornetzi]|uniref:Putative malonyl-CoA-acyl carrier protein transacylase, mitochondrial n=1 Tax=Trachymyrmex cornetzi TaxID=471704 RepID=A0A151J0Y9_9HYME|nr:PREDICTED: probable malonyl-CoA-acyl carrier protein transacylase, mitochondrial [Trachymyrmex cornetzi]KYN15473.1 putative malonyl-CoA-acyl carrier protein transacylase, mitochondrial [Trachymyrmex cornetzi]
MQSVTILQRVLSAKTAPCLTRLLFLRQVNKYSDSAATKNDSSNTSNIGESQNERVASDVESSLGEENVSRLLKEAASYSDAKDKNWTTSPYPADAPTSVEEEVVKPKIDPLDTCIVLFPGQGTIKVGMVQKYLRFPQARELFEIANEILGYDLLKLCLRGPQEKLNQTCFNQPATVVSSLAALEQLREERPRVFETCKAAVGYSVGELTALIFSGALSFENGIRLVSVRGAAMQYASNKCPQGMLSVQCSPQASLSQACKDAEKWAQDCGVEIPVCQVAVYLYTQSKILAGNTQALEYIEENAKKYGLFKLTRLPVSGAFHTTLMEPALKSFGKMLHTLEFDDFRCHVYSNYKAHPYGNTALIRKYLPKQIMSSVKWEQCIQLLYNRPPGTAFPRTFDVGSGGRMSTILKLINSKAHQHCIAV